MDKKVVFITGASKGIGRATAEKFVREGWQVAGFYGGHEMTNEPGINYYQLDVGNWDNVNSAFDKAFSDVGRMDALVNCAGVYGYKTLDQYDMETMEKVISVNEVGVYLTTKKAVTLMKSGSIVHIASTAGQVGSSDPIYAGTKSAVTGFVKSMAKALGPDIRVNCVAPGVTESDMTRNMNPERLKQLIEMTLLKKAAVPTDIANGIYFLTSDQASHITGTCLDINGGYVLR